MFLFLDSNASSSGASISAVAIVAVLVIALIIALFLYFKTCVVIVKQGTKKVIERFGVYHKTLSEGFHLIFKPFDKVAPVPWQVLSKNQKDLIDLATRDSYNQIKLDELKEKIDKFTKIEKDLQLEKEYKIKQLRNSYYSEDIGVKNSISNSSDSSNVNKIVQKYKRSKGDSLTDSEVNGDAQSISSNADANASVYYGRMNNFYNKKQVVNADSQSKSNFAYVDDVDNYKKLEEQEVEIECYYNNLIEAKRNELLNAYSNYDSLDDDDALSMARHQAALGIGKSKFDLTLESDDILDYVDMRERFIDSNPQKVITKDNATFNVDTCIFFCVTNVFDYYYGANEPETAIKLLAITTLRNILATMTLEEALVSRQNINESIRKVLDDATNPWGIKVNRVEIKEFILGSDIENAMNSVLISERNKRSSILASDAEAYKIQILREAEAKGYEKIKAASLDETVLRIRGYEALRDVADGKATKIFLPNNLDNIITGSNILADALNTKDSKEEEASEEIKK